jgi:hypothetical protein
MTTPASNNADSPLNSKSILHVRSRGHVSAVATGVAVTGPTDDGFVHLHFFREIQRILHEDVPIEQVSEHGLMLDWSHAKASVHLQREEVATLSIPVTRYASMIEALSSASSVISRFGEQIKAMPQRGKQ